MTENEAIEALRLINTSRVHPFYSWEEMAEVRDIAISALKEIKQYREIGTVEQVRNQKHNLEMAYKIISDYELCGTVEECRGAMEKQKPKKIIIESYCPTVCPTCGNELSTSLGDGYYKYPTFLERCPNCGQAILWENEDD